MQNIKYKIIFLILFLIVNSFANDKYYKLGLSAIMSKKYDIAEIMLKSSYLLDVEKLVPKNDYNILTILGHTYFLDQRYDLSKKCYYELTQTNNKHFCLIGKFMYAESCVYSEDYKTAEKLYSELELLNDVDNILPYILYGKIYTLYKLEKYTSVLTNILKFNEYSKKVDEDIKEQVLYLLSESWYKKGSLKDARREFDKFTKLYKNSQYLPYSNLRLAQIFAEQKQYASSINFLQDLSLEKFKDTASEVIIKYNLGRILIKQKKYNSAEKIYLELLENKFNDDIKDYLRLDLGYIYIETQKYDKAIKVLSKIKSSDYKIISRVEFLLGISYYCSNKYEEVVKIFTKFVNKYGKKNNLYDDVNYWLGLSYMNLERYQEAISIFKNLVDKKSSIYSQSSEFFIAKCYINTKEYELAKNILNKLLDKVKNEDIIADIYYELGQCYKFSCEYLIAEQYFAKNVSRKDMKGIESQVALADVYLRSQKYDEAEKIIEDVLNKNIYTLKSRAQLLLFAIKYNKKDFVSAINIATEIDEKNLSNSEKIFLYNNLTKIYLNNNDFANAMKCLDILSKNAFLPKEKFAIEIQKLNIMLVRDDTEKIVRHVEYLISQYTKPEQISYLYFKLIKYFSQQNDNSKVLDYIIKIQNLKNDRCLNLLSKDEVIDFINISLNTEITVGLYFAYMIPNMPQLNVREKVDIFSRVGQLCVENKQYTSALKFAAMLKQLSMDTDSMLLSEYIIGKSYEYMGRLSNAESVYKSIIEKYSDSKHIAKVYVSMINILRLLKKTDLVTKYEDILLSMYPNTEETYQYLFETAKMYETEKKYEEAIKRYSLVTNSKNIELQALSQKFLGDCYYNLGKYKESSVEYLKVIYLYPQYSNLCAEAQFMVGKCCEHLKLLDEAKRAYNSAVKNYSGTLWAQEAEQQLKIFK